MHESNPHIGAGLPESRNNISLPALESVYRCYGQGIYTFCLRLLANDKAAESATVDVFVRFGKELISRPDESKALLRLRELAIKASLDRVNDHGRTILRRLSQSLCLALPGIWRRLTHKEVHK